MRKLHIEGLVWQYKVGSRFISFLTPEGKRVNIAENEILGNIEPKMSTWENSKGELYDTNRSLYPSRLKAFIMQNPERFNQHNPLVIQQVDKPPVSAIMSVLNQVYKKAEYRAICLNDLKNGTVFTATLHGQVIGFAFICASHISGNIAELAWVTVLPKHQGKGIGTRLKIARLDWARKSGFTTVLVKTQHSRLYKEFQELKNYGKKSLLLLEL